MRHAVAAWAETTEIDEATTTPPPRLRRDALYDRVCACLERIMGRPVSISALPADPDRAVRPPL